MNASVGYLFAMIVSFALQKLNFHITVSFLMDRVKVASDLISEVKMIRVGIKAMQTTGLTLDRNVQNYNTVLKSMYERSGLWLRWHSAGLSVILITT